MRSRSMVLLALALGCGLVASIGISQVMDRRNTAEAPVSEMEEILVAKADIHYNDLLTPDSVNIAEWPKGKVPAGAMTRLEEIQGRRSATKLYAGEPILSGKLMGSDGAGAAGKIPKGLCVVSVKVDNVTGASSLIKVDDRVDVLLYMAARADMGITTTSVRTILHDVRIFAVGAGFERKHSIDELPTASAPTTVSLLVTREQAEKVTLATEMGTIRLVMRNPDDNSEPESSGAHASDIFGNGHSNPDGDRQPGAEFGLSTAPRGQELANSSTSSGTSAPAPLPIAAAPAKPATWTMVLLQGSEMTQVELSTGVQFPVITSQRVDYQPDPPTSPAAPPADTSDTTDSNASSDDNAPLRQPTAFEEGFGDPMSAGPNN